MSAGQLRAATVEWYDAPIFRHCTKEEIDTSPIRNAYSEITPKVNKLNKQARNYNIKTNLKIALFITTCCVVGIGIAFASFSLAGIVIPIAPWSLKVVATAGIVFAGVKKIVPIFCRVMNKTQNEFSLKINSELENTYKSNEIKQAFDQTILSWYPLNDAEFCQSYFTFTINKVKLASLKTVEKKYVDSRISQENNRREVDSRISQENNSRGKESNNGWSRFLPSFSRNAMSS